MKTLKLFIVMILASVLLPSIGCRKARSRDLYNSQVQRIEAARAGGKITEAQYIRLIQDAENAYSGREDTNRPVPINNNYNYKF